MNDGAEHAYTMDIVRKVGLRAWPSIETLTVTKDFNLRNANKYDCLDVMDTTAERLLTLQAEDGNTIAHHFQLWLEDDSLFDGPDHDPVPTAMIYVEYPVSLLLIKTPNWNKLALSWIKKIHRRCPYKTWFKELFRWRPVLQDEVVLQARAADQLEESNQSRLSFAPFSRSAFEDLNAFLRNLVAQLMALRHDEPDNQDMNDAAAHWVKWIEGLGQATSPEEFVAHSWKKSRHRGSHWSHLAGSRGAYQSSFILNCLQITLFGPIGTREREGQGSSKKFLSLHLDRMIKTLPDALSSSLSPLISENVQVPS